MNEYQIIIRDGEIMTGYGYTSGDMLDLMDYQQGMSRTDVAHVRLLARRAAAASGDEPYIVPSYCEAMEMAA